MINNHRNFWSIPYLAQRARPGSLAPGALNREILNLFTQRDFALRKTRSLGVWPQSDRRTFLGSWGATTRIEQFNLRYASRHHRLGADTIFLLQNLCLAIRPSMSPRRGLTSTAISGAGYTLAGSGAQSLASLLVLVVLSRLLTPRDFGLMAAAMIVITLSQLLSQVGVGAGLVQKTEKSRMRTYAVRTATP